MRTMTRRGGSGLSRRKPDPNIPAASPSMAKGHLRAHLPPSANSQRLFFVIPVSPQAKTGTQRKKESLGPGHLLRKSRDDDQRMLWLRRAQEMGPQTGFAGRG